MLGYLTGISYYHYFKMKKILLVTNSQWNIVNFRRKLIEKILKKKINLVICSPEDKFQININDSHLKFIPINFSRNSINLFFNMKTIYKFYRIFLSQNPDKILLFTIKPNILGSIAAILTFKKIYIYNFITGLGTFYFSNIYFKKIIMLLYKISFLNSKKIIFQNIEDLNFFVNNKIISKSKSVLIPGSGVDSKYFKFSKIKKVIDRKFNFLCMSRLIKDKGIIEYIESAKLIKKEYPNVIFNLVGSIDDENISYLDKSLITNNKFIRHHEFTDDIYSFLKNCDCFILPSYREGTSRALLEAASIGRPLISTDVPGCNNIVVNNFNGYLCKIKDINSLYSSIKKMINLDYNSRVKMGYNSRKLVEKNFEIEIINKKIFKEINLNYE
jgi:glycosyltransferase involved in cell wall biosynthesis|tara:strand:- start:251 stop:1408 length:1158 start_codon:yes stop_codon:yes gene_type:complete